MFIYSLQTQLAGIGYSHILRTPGFSVLNLVAAKATSASNIVFLTTSVVVWLRLVPFPWYPTLAPQRLHAPSYLRRLAYIRNGYSYGPDGFSRKGPVY